MPLIPGLEVVRSAIDGHGVIAKRPFAADELIAEVDGVAWNAQEDLNDRYSLKITEEILFDMVDQTRWINHSCDPNCEAVEENGRVFMDAVCPIESGDEVTIDYNLYLEVRYTAALKREYACVCGTVQCRGTMLASKR